MPKEGLEQNRAALTGQTGKRLVDTVMFAARMLLSKFPGGTFTHTPYETWGVGVEETSFHYASVFLFFGGGEASEKQRSSSPERR